MLFTDSNQIEAISGREASPWDDLSARSADLSERLAAQANRDDDDGGSGFPAEAFRLMAEEGWLAAPLDRRFGGAGLGSEPGMTLPLLQLLKQVGRGSLPVGRIYEGHVNALMLVQRFGTREQAERCAADARDHGRIFGVWNAEGRDDGVKLLPLGGGRCRMEGGKHFASGLGHVERPVVTGRLPDGGWQMCVVPMETVRARMDFSWWRPLGMEATVSGAVDFTGIELGPEAIIGLPDVYYKDPWFNGGAIRFLSVQLGGAEALYDAARGYLRQTGQSEHPAQRTRVAEMAVAIESGALWLRGAAAMFERPDEEAPAIIAYAAMARMAIETICLDVIRATERCVGARGLLRPWPFERMVRDLTMYLRQPAPDAIVERVGRHALDHPQPAHAQWRHGQD
jgi:alkylation response protein AidB-like acyl-CoA dehydrogenase